MLSRAKRMPFSSALQYHLHFVLSGCLLLVGKALVTAQVSLSCAPHVQTRTPRSDKHPQSV